MLYIYIFNSEVDFRKKNIIREILLRKCLEKYTVYICVQLVPIKTLQSLHAKFKVINENFETNFDCTMMPRDWSFVYRLFHLNR